MCMMGYYLANGIYPDWKIMVKTISDPEGCKKQHFVTKQEVQRKDIEQAFGVLQVSHIHCFTTCLLNFSISHLLCLLISFILYHFQMAQW